MAKFRPDQPDRAAAVAPPVTRPIVDLPAKKVMRVTRYDRVAALLVALLIIVATVVFMMSVIWASGKVFVRQAPVQAQLIEPLSGGGNATGSARDLLEPGEEEVEELLEPQLEETLDAVTDLLSDQLATLDSLGGDEALTSAGGGAGDGRQPGEGGDSDVIPRWQRWQVKFAVGNLNAYAKQLDFFGIELGAAGGTEMIDYAFNFTQAEPDRRSGDPAADRRLYMTWRYGPLRTADIALMKNAGVKTENRILMQFVPPAVENTLATVEQAYVNENGRTINDVKRTVFAVVGRGGKYEFQVESQQTR